MIYHLSHLVMLPYWFACYLEIIDYLLNRKPQKIMSTKYNLEQLIKITLHEKTCPRFEYYQLEKRGWFNIITQKQGYYSMLGFSGSEPIDKPFNTYLENNVLYYLPHIDYKFVDGSTKTQWFESLTDAKKIYDLHKLVEINNIP